jgi:hypothetical protein
MMIADGVLRSYPLPRVTDPDGDAYSITTFLDLASTFTTYKDGVLQFIPIKGNEGTYTINLAITDNNVNPKT